jgi:hypothetical protein
MAERTDSSADCSFFVARFRTKKEGTAITGTYTQKPWPHPNAVLLDVRH